MTPRVHEAWSAALAALVVACGAGGGRDRPDAGATDAGTTDAAPGDAGAIDAGSADARAPGDGACRSSGSALGLPGPPLVSTGADPSVGALPARHALVDLDGDCRLDLVVVDEPEGRVSVARGLDGARFAPPRALSTGGHPRAVTAADVDGDGAPDLVVAVPTTRTVLVWRTRVPLGFDEPITTTVDGEPVALAAADLDADGRTDVAVMTATFGHWGAEGSTASVIALRNVGGGLVPAPAAWSWDGSGGEASSWIRAADLDADGLPELVVSGPSPASVLRNLGGLAFGDGQELAAGGEPAIADFDGDGRPDLAAVAGGAVQVFLNAGDGRFAAGAATPIADAVQSLVSADLDLDGRADLAASVLLGMAPTPTPQETLVLAGRGDGTFETGAPVRTGAGEGFAAALLAGDLDGDGAPDLVAVRGVSMTSVPLMNDGAGRLVVPAVVSASDGPREAPGRLVSLATGDLDGDGRPDALAAFATWPGDAASLRFLRNEGGSLRHAATHSLGAGSPGEVALGDLDGDGSLDAVVALPGSSLLAVCRGRGTGELDPPVLTGTSEQPDPVALADLDGDGDLDVVVGARTGLDVLLNEAGRLGARATYPGGAFLWRGALALADLDGDGDPDVAAVDGEAGVVRLWRNGGDGTLGEPDELPVGVTWGPIAAADLDADGDVDLVVVEGQAAEPGAVRVATNRGDGSFDAGITYPVGMQPGAVRVADLDGDGRLDLVTGNTTSNGTGPSVGVLLGRADGAFEPQLAFPTTGYAGSLALADLDGDARLDVVAAVDQGEGPRVAVLRNRTW